jgi:hypothetical protein
VNILWYLLQNLRSHTSLLKRETVKNRTITSTTYSRTPISLLNAGEAISWHINIHPKTENMTPAHRRRKNSPQLSINNIALKVTGNQRFGVLLDTPRPINFEVVSAKANDE